MPDCTKAADHAWLGSKRPFSLGSAPGTAVAKRLHDQRERGRGLAQSLLENLKVDEWVRMIDVNIDGALWGIAAALPHVQRQKAGHIINVPPSRATRSMRKPPSPAGPPGR